MVAALFIRAEWKTPIILLILPVNMASVDAEFDSELNPSGFETNERSKANMEMIYCNKFSTKSVFFGFFLQFSPENPFQE